MFAAWADPSAKAGGSGRAARRSTSSTSASAAASTRASARDGALYSFDAVYQDIVPGERIVHTYDMHRDDARISVSVATIELSPSGDGTNLTLTEQGVFLDGLDTPAGREHGTSELMDALGEAPPRVGSA